MLHDNVDIGLSCRFCGAALQQTFVDLGMSPLCQTHISVDQLNSMERFYPLHAYVCTQCFLVQLGEYVTPDEIFTEYAYFSSYADTWLKHVEGYVEMMVSRFQLNDQSKVVEIASNDGYLLQYFVKKNISVVGVEPAANVAKVAIEKGIPTVVKFFGRETARQLVDERGKADVVLGNNVLAHVPGLNDFVGGMKILLASKGVITMEFPHLIRLIEENQFDTIYHEHFSYFSFSTVAEVFRAHDLTLFDVDEIPTHGGSLRIYAKHSDDNTKQITARVEELKRREETWGIHRIEAYLCFAKRVAATKRSILRFLIRAKENGRMIAGYGAPGKGNTLLNYCGIQRDFIDYTVDRSPYKQGKYLPGTHIPILNPSKIAETKPDYLFILPWNLKDEVMEQNSFIREWGGEFAVPIPTLRVYA